MARFTNQAQLAYRNRITTSNIAVGEILEVLSAAKHAVIETYESYDVITYVVSLVNSGTTALTGLVLTDNLGAYTFNEASLFPLQYVANSLKYYVNGVLQTSPVIASQEPLRIEGISIPAQGNAVVIYQAALTQFAPPATDSTITNQAIISGTGISSITVEETISALAEPILNITKSISPVPVTENGALTYTFVIENRGNVPADPADLIVITDQFNPILSDLTVTFNGTAWAEGTQYTYNQTTGLFTTKAGEITVPAATFTQNADTGAWSVIPGTSTLVITGTV